MPIYISRLQRFILYIFLLVNVLVLQLVYSEEDSNGKCVHDHHNPDAVKNSAIEARSLLTKTPTSVPIEDRLLVMILFAKGLTKHQRERRLHHLECALKKLVNNMMNLTTADVFIWTLNTTEYIPSIPTWFTKEAFPRINVININESTWRVGCGLKHDSQWAARAHFDVDYYLMGRWRLTFSLDFAREMGYRYHLQFDDDAMLNSPLPYNVVEHMKKKEGLMGVFSDYIGEVHHLTLGLPELTAYWMKVVNYQPKGDLFNHVNPKNIQGLTSDGFDRMYHPGYWIVIDTHWWFQDEVQDYLTTVLRSGRDVEGRWQEQAVINMMRLLFIPSAQMIDMVDVDIGHDRRNKKNFEAWCLNQGLVTHDS